VHGKPEIKHIAVAVKSALNVTFGSIGPQLIDFRDEAAVSLAGAVETNPYLWSLPMTQGLTDELVSALQKAEEGICQLGIPRGMSPCNMTRIVKLACKILKGRQIEKERLAREDY